MKRMLLILVALVACLTLTVPAMACYGPDCADNVESHVSGSFGAYDSDGFNRDTGTRGANAFADGYGAGSFEANSYGDEYAHTSGRGAGSVTPMVGAAGGSNWVASGALSIAGSHAGAFAENDGGERDAFAEVHGGVYQSNGAYITDGPGNFANGGNQSSASYSNSDYSSYGGEWVQDGGIYRHWVRGRSGRGHWVYKMFKNYPPQGQGWHLVIPFFDYECRPGDLSAYTSGGAITGGGTFVYSQNNGNTATSFGATGSFSVGNNGVSGNGYMETGTYVSNGSSGASGYTSGSYSYSGNGFGAGATFGGSTANVGPGHASVSAHHTSIATGGGGGQPD